MVMRILLQLVLSKLRETFLFPRWKASSKKATKGVGGRGRGRGRGGERERGRWLSEQVWATRYKIELSGFKAYFSPLFFFPRELKLAFSCFNLTLAILIIYSYAIAFH